MLTTAVSASLAIVVGLGVVIYGGLIGLPLLLGSAAIGAPALLGSGLLGSPLLSGPLAGGAAISPILALPSALISSLQTYANSGQ